MLRISRLTQTAKAGESGPRHHTDDDAAEAEDGHDCAEAGQHVQAVLSATFHRQNHWNVRPWTPQQQQRCPACPGFAVAGPILLRHRLHKSWHGLVKWRSDQLVGRGPFLPGAACPVKRSLQCTTRHLQWQTPEASAGREWTRSVGPGGRCRVAVLKSSRQ